MKINILKTFEDFLKEPLSILKRTIVNVVGIESLGAKKSVSAQINGNTIQINVVNSQKVYNLLSSVTYKKQIGELRHLINENKKSEI